MTAADTSISLADFGHSVINRSKHRPILLCCQHPRCPRCRQMAAILRMLAQDLGPAIELHTIDVEREDELAEQLDAGPLPDMRLFLDGRQVDRLLGPVSAKQVLAWLRPHLPSPAAGAIAAAEAAINERNRTVAFDQARQAVRADQQNPEAFTVQIRAALLNHDSITARAALTQLRALDGGAELAEQLSPVVELEAERFRYANVDQESLSGRFGKALAALAKKDKTETCEHLLAIVEEDPDWEGGKAYRRLCDILEQMDANDPHWAALRQRLDRATDGP